MASKRPWCPSSPTFIRSCRWLKRDPAMSMDEAIPRICDQRLGNGCGRCIGAQTTPTRGASAPFTCRTPYWTGLPAHGFSGAIEVRLHRIRIGPRRESRAGVAASCTLAPTGCKSLFASRHSSPVRAPLITGAAAAGRALQPRPRAAGAAGSTSTGCPRSRFGTGDSCLGPPPQPLTVATARVVHGLNACLDTADFPQTSATRRPRWNLPRWRGSDR